MKPILEPIHLGEQKTITAFTYQEDNFEVPWHFHPQHELTFIESSFGTKFIGDYVGPYEPGELVLVRSNLPHCWKNQEQDGVPSQSIVIQWNKGVFAKVPELDTLFEMLTTASKGIIFEKKSIRQLIPELKNLLTLSSDDLYINFLGFLLRLSKCAYTTLSDASFVDDIPHEHNNRMTRVHDFIEKSFERKIYLKEVADLVNMSEQSFSRFFNKMMGRSFFTFLNEYRINMASRMLLYSDKSVSQISYDCGYESPPFFFKKFNEVYEMSPTKYRKKYLK
ncbi:AraC family transcriptional regulator [Flavobacterium faecale]|uniref:AraC family transcriptional regulator n=1 Tax=Flavobacterium faecale TaxID=1355330 RepID=A0A2S1LG35_9FLAO|nr:AraC family transcriptional regulator [Flavobacterium faecale]AWG22742.1 AraC family transcriptional regulator [Flavobacterium faecale]